MKIIILQLALIVPVLAAGQPVEDGLEHLQPKEILEVGKREGRVAVARLRAYRERKRSDRLYRAHADSAQMALARLGESKEMAEIVEESKSDDPLIQNRSFRKLEYVANRTAVRALIARLDDSEFKTQTYLLPDGTKVHSDVVLPPPSSVAIRTLEKIVRNPPTQDSRRVGEREIGIWKAWWKANRKEYE